MKAQNTDKREYTVPLFERIQLDNEISLALESIPTDVPPTGPGEFVQAEHFNNDSFKNNMG